jgi:hypothetical protein
MRITEVEGIPQDELKKKYFPLYKAFIFSKPGKDMTINENAEMMGITPDAAVYQLLQEIPLEVFENELNKAFSDFADFWKSPVGKLDNDDKEYLYKQMTIDEAKDGVYEVEMKDVVVSFAIFKMDTADLKTKELVDGGADFFQNGILGITLKDKLYKLDVTEMQLLSFKLTVNLENEARIISDIKLKDVNKKK